MRRLILLVALLVTTALPAAAKDYSADRYDVTIRPMADGAIQVTETLRLTFVGGPFTFVNREIPLRETDGIEVLGASMDGRVMRRGTGAGQFEVRTRNSRVVIRWHFSGTSDASHDFRLSYLARGVVQRAGASGLLEWQALPSQHSYRITTSRIVVEGVGMDREPSIRTRRVDDVRVARAGEGWAIEARGIGSNGWIALATSAPLADGAIPRWQVREERQRALAPRMIQFGAIAAVFSLAVVLLVWRQYPARPLMDAESGPRDSPPVPRPPAIAAAILAGGHATNAHAPGALFDLASRGIIAIAERERRWKTVRRFTMTRGAPGALAPHEAALLDVMFRGEETVDFTRAASRLARGGKPFRHAVNEELLRLALTDEQRRSARRRLFLVGLGLVVLSVAAAALAVAGGVGPWGLAVPLGMCAAAVLALILAATRPELSDEGYRERERWRGFRRGLKEQIGSMGLPRRSPQAEAGSMGLPRRSPQAEAGSSAPDFAPMRYLPYVAALGLAVPFARFLKKHGAQVALPSWFRAMADSGDGSAAFAAFIGSSAHSADGHGAGGSGAAGGGSSGAG